MVTSKSNVYVPAGRGSPPRCGKHCVLFSRRQSRNLRLRRGLDSSSPSYFSLSRLIITYLKQGANIYRLKYVNLRQESERGTIQDRTYDRKAPKFYIATRGYLVPVIGSPLPMSEQTQMHNETKQ